MSMYSHPAPPFSQIPPQPSYSYPSYPSAYQYGPPSTSYLMDPVSFRRDYMGRLAELTVNSRPIIQNLSMVAQEYSRYADVVTECIEQHIRRVPPWIKLPAWYLLDAISKNVHEPYARHFASIVAPLFLDSYAVVDPNTRSKMEEMLLTWRNGHPSGQRELFGVGPQVAIERGIWSGGSSDPSFQQGQGFISKPQVLTELEFTLGQMERAVQMNPYDAQAQAHINVLQQLRKLVEAGVSQKELQQILNQLRSMARPPSVAPHTPAPPMKYPPSSPNDTYYSEPAPYSAPPPPPIAPSQHQYDQPFPSRESFEPVPPAPAPASSSMFVQMDTTPPAPVASTSTAPAIPNISNLFEVLRKAGVVSSTGTPTGAEQVQAATIASAQNPEDVKPENLVDPIREDTRSYRDDILSENIRLTGADINRRQPRIVEFLYNRLPAQCKQCGLRFTDSSLGKNQMQEHLDMHFRQNRKANQHVGRGHSRSWFVALEDWIHDNGKGKGPADPSRPSNVKAAAAADAAKRDAELRAQFVVVPPGDEAKPIACPICKETLKSEFQEDDEEWVWKNAVDVEGRIYHATCHAEALMSTTSLAAKLRQELTGGGRSRSTTPERSVKMRTKSESPVSPGKAQIIGVKRKAEPTDESSLGSLLNGGGNGGGDVNNGGDGWDSGEPPVKKTVASAAA